jgi:hypothetical protein
MEAWFDAAKRLAKHIPCVVAANKIDVDYKVTWG